MNQRRVNWCSSIAQMKGTGQGECDEEVKGSVHKHRSAGHEKQRSTFDLDQRDWQTGINIGGNRSASRKVEITQKWWGTSSRSIGQPERLQGKRLVEKARLKGNQQGPLMGSGETQPEHGSLIKQKFKRTSTSRTVGGGQNRKGNSVSAGGELARLPFRGQMPLKPTCKPNVIKISRAASNKYRKERKPRERQSD